MQLIDAGPLPQHPAGEVDTPESEGGKPWARDVKGPATTRGLNFSDAGDDQITDFRVIARAEWGDGEELVGFVQRASKGGNDSGRVRGGGAMASHVLRGGRDELARGEECGGRGIIEVHGVVDICVRRGECGRRWGRRGRRVNDKGHGG